MLDFGIGASALHLWVAAGSAALLVACCAATFVLPTIRAAVARAIPAALGASITWASSLVQLFRTTGWHRCRA
jgi:hypothetical protein